MGPSAHCLIALVVIYNFSSATATSTVFAFNGTYRLMWDFDDKFITFTVDADFYNNTGVILSLMGTSGLAKQDIALMFFNNSDRPVLKDGFYDSYNFSIDTQQDLCINSANKTNDRGSFTFTRKRNLCDSNDTALQTFPTKVSFGYSPMLPEGLPDLQRLTLSTIYVSLLNPRPIEPLQSDTTSLDPLPTEVSYTNGMTMTCSLVNLQAANKVHVVKMEPIITAGNSDDILIMTLFGCDGDASDMPASFDCTSAVGLQNFARCTSLIAARSKGDDAYVFPPDVGLPIGGSTGLQWAILQKIFVKSAAGTKKDSSYFRLWISNVPRTYEAGTMLMGINVGAYAPQAAASYTTRISGYCPSPCLGESAMSKTGGINIISTMLSTAMTANRITLRHYSAAQSQELAVISDDPLHQLPIMNYIKPARNLMPGDVLQVVCDISRQGGRSAFQGSPSVVFPACIAAIHYYPKTNLSACTTKPSYTVNGSDDFYTVLGTSIGSFNWSAGTSTGVPSLSDFQTVANTLEKKYTSGTLIATCRGDKVVDIPWTVTGLGNTVFPDLNSTGTSCVSAPTNCSRLTMITAPTLPPATTTTAAGTSEMAGGLTTPKNGAASHCQLWHAPGFLSLLTGLLIVARLNNG